MQEFVRHFFGQGVEAEFSLFTFAHFAPILVAVALIFAIYRFREPLRNWKREHVIRYTLAFILICSEMAYYWR
nr:hypothetical protein [Oscillospiraceae bacterium]